MIPKTIHYCWFGRGKKPYLIRKCIESWKKLMPEYTIQEWNEDNFDINIFPYVSQAYSEKRWAFVADVCRFYACYTEGGIYMDTDVEALKPLDEFLSNSFFCGTEVQGDTDKSIMPDAAMFGCEKGHWLAKECFEWYSRQPFKDVDGNITGGIVEVVLSQILRQYEYRHIDDFQQIKDIKIYPSKYFSNVSDTQNLKLIYTLHHFDGSWVDAFSKKSFLHTFCRKHDLMHWYRRVGNMITRAKSLIKH